MPEITDAPARVGFLARMRAMFGGGKTAEPAADPEPEPVAVAQSEPEPVAVAQPEPEPAAVAQPEPEPAAVAQPEPEPDPAPVPEPEPIAVPEPATAVGSERAVDPEAVLSAALDSLGQAHHRPFSRA